MRVETAQLVERAREHAPTALTKLVCRLKGHPPERHFQLSLLCTVCEPEHQVAKVVCCGRCYQALYAIETA